MNLFNKSITSFEKQKNIHIRKYYKAIISTDESHASLKKVKLRQGPIEHWGEGGGHGFLFWVKQFCLRLARSNLVFFIREFFFIINHDLNG
jgi:hypothetical protein